MAAYLPGSIPVPLIGANKNNLKGAQSMQKIKLTVLKNMIAAKLSKYEVLFLVTIARYQDDKGQVLGVYYKDICKELGRLSGKEKISYQKFYDCIKSLEHKGLISVEKGFKDRNIRIVANDFSDGSYYEGYISVGHTIFYLQEFGQLKANEMLMCMDFMKNCEAGKRGSICIGVEKFYNKYAQMLSVSKRVIQGYLTHLRKFFSIGIKDGLYWVEIRRHTLSKLPKNSEGYAYRKHVGESIFRCYRIKYTEQTFTDTVNLMYQYGAKAKGNITSIFTLAVAKSLALINKGVLNKYKWDRELRPKLVHKLIREALASQEVLG